MAEVWVPRQSQERLLGFLEDRGRGAVWAGCGTGKTAVAATWLDSLMFDKLAVRRALVVTPRLVCPGWLTQMERWSHLGMLRRTSGVVSFDELDMAAGDVLSWAHDGETKVADVARGMFKMDGKKVVAAGEVPTRLATRIEGRELLSVRPGGLVFRDKRAAKRRLLARPERLLVCPWNVFPWLEDALGSAWPFDAVFFDESSFLRDQGSTYGRAARRAVHKSGEVEVVGEATATPAANHQEAVYAQLDLIQPGALGRTLTEFRETLCLPDRIDRQTGRAWTWKLNPGKREQFDAICRTMAASVPDQLGVPVVEVPHYVALPAVGRTEYLSLKKNQVLPDVTAASAAVLHSKLLQICSGWVYPDTEPEEQRNARPVHDAKVERMRELVDEIQSQVLVAYRYQFEIEWLRRVFGKRLADVNDRGAWDRFKAGELPMLALHPASAGHGLDGAQAVCNHVIFTSVPEDAEHYQQALGRLRREGQSRTVFVHVLVASDSREGDVWTERLKEKQAAEVSLVRAVQLG